MINPKICSINNTIIGVAEVLLRKKLGKRVSSLNLIFKLKNTMSLVDFLYVLLKRSLFQNMKKKKKWHHVNTLKPGPE